MKIIIVFLTVALYGGAAIAENICNNPRSYSVGTNEECEKECPNRKVNNAGSGSGYTARNCALKECPNDKPLRTTAGDCFSCDAPRIDGYVEDIENCKLCPNREQPKNTTFCALKKCPKDAPLRNWKGECYECDSEDHDSKYNVENCEACPNREKVKHPPKGVESCELLHDPNAIMATDGKCPKDKPLKRWDGRCFPCDEKEPVGLDSKCNDFGKCDGVCPNREIVYDVGGNIPSYIKCPPESPLRGENGRCFACDYEWDIGMRFQDPKKCAAICSGRFQEKGGALCMPKTAKRYRASFDCGDISKLQRHERVICSNENYGNLDIKMAGLYKRVLEKFKDDADKLAKIKSEQKEWVKKTKDGFISDLYESRIKELEELLK